MRNVLIFFFAIFLVSSCTTTESENKQLVYQNIVILSDLSNRITNPQYPQKDRNEIHKIVFNISNQNVSNLGRKSVINQVLHFLLFLKRLQLVLI